MNDEDIRRILDDEAVYDEAKEWRLRTVLGDLYNRQTLLPVIVMWINALLAIALGVVSVVLFFGSDQVKQEILYATLFLVAWIWLIGAKVMGWLMMIRNKISRDVKRLEIRLADRSR